jgi:hypothetical protein
LELKKFGNHPVFHFQSILKQRHHDVFSKAGEIAGLVLASHNNQPNTSGSCPWLFAYWFGLPPKNKFALD